LTFPYGETKDAMTGGLKIGELARRAGVTPKAIRFYERKGGMRFASLQPLNSA
jgi:MerR family regulatory protein